MKPNLKNLFSVFLVVINITGFAKKTKTVRTDGHRSFFYQTDEKNWAYVLKDKNIDVSLVFKIDYGVLRISGESSGYLRTKSIY